MYIFKVCYYIILQCIASHVHGSICCAVEEKRSSSGSKRSHNERIKNEIPLWVECGIRKIKFSTQILFQIDLVEEPFVPSYKYLSKVEIATLVFENHACT